METITITPAIAKEIRAYAQRFVGGFGMRLELGLRCQPGKGTYYNCLTTGDDMDGDLYDHTPWSGVKGLLIPTIEGKVVLDFDAQEQRGKVIIEEWDALKG